MALKPRLGFTEDHRKCHHSIEHVWLPINVPQQQWAYVVSFPRFSEM